MEFLDKLFPGWAYRRAQYRLATAQIERAYEAAEASAYRKIPRFQGSADAAMDNAKSSLRDWARYLDENSDLAIAVLDDLVNGIIGEGLRVVPLVEDNNGDLHEELNEQISDFFTEFERRPEVTRTMTQAEADRLAVRTWLRDGELIVIDRINPNYVQQGFLIPYAQQYLEADFLPFDFSDASQGIVHGVEKDSDGRPVAYHLYRDNPNDLVGRTGFVDPQRLIRIDADIATHLRFTRRFNQTRGTSCMHGVITRLDDIKDAEESERIAMRIAASLSAVIYRRPGMMENPDQFGNQSMEMKAGMIMDTGTVADDIKIVGSDRPNTQLVEFLKSQDRRVAGGTGSKYSTISRNFVDGSYSAQRQESVESSVNYDKLRNYYVEMHRRPAYERALQFAISSGIITRQRGFNPDTLFRAMFVAPKVRWIQPNQEVGSEIELIDAGLKSKAQHIIERGGNPNEIRKQVQREREQDAEQTANQESEGTSQDAEQGEAGNDDTASAA